MSKRIVSDDRPQLSSRIVGSVDHVRKRNTAVDTRGIATDCLRAGQINTHSPDRIARVIDANYDPTVRPGWRRRRSVVETRERQIDRGLWREVDVCLYDRLMFRRDRVAIIATARNIIDGSIISIDPNWKANSRTGWGN